MKKILSLLVAFVCLWSILLPGQEADAAAKINSWDLVDSSKHLDYSGNSKYMSFIQSGANTWNAYKKGLLDQLQERINQTYIVVIFQRIIISMQRLIVTGKSLLTRKIWIKKIMLENKMLLHMSLDMACDSGIMLLVT